MAVRPVVVDSNALRDDLLYALETGHRTALLDAADGYGMRPFCPEHVALEVKEHFAEWVANRGNEAEARRIFDQQYRPLLRVVAVPSGPLHAEEARRIDRLLRKDADDVPTAILALMLDAPVLTRDHAVLQAVYGDDVDLEAQKRWVDLAQAGRVLSDTDRAAWGTAVLLQLASYGAYSGVRALLRLLAALPLAAQAIILGSAAVALYLGRSRIATAAKSSRETLRTIAEQLGPVIAQVLSQRELAVTMLLAARPPSGRDANYELPGIPEASSTEALTRLCIYALSRSDARSAASLARDLPPQLDIPVGEAKVRSVLRTQPCFHRIPPGRYQVGRPWPGPQHSYCKAGPSG
jgi:predicted nucleic acid-binding protein